MGNSPIDVRHVRAGHPISARGYNKLVDGARGAYRGGPNSIVTGQRVYTRESILLAGNSVWPEQFVDQVIYEEAGGDVTQILTRNDRNKWHVVNMFALSFKVTLTLPASPQNQDMFFFGVHRAFGAPDDGLFIIPNVGHTIQIGLGIVASLVEFRIKSSSTAIKYFNGVWYTMLGLGINPTF